MKSRSSTRSYLWKVTSSSYSEEGISLAPSIRENYRSIGSALTSRESTLSRWLGWRESCALGDAAVVGSRLHHFRTAVAFIGTEVLQSYLEDLLDLSVSEERLWIQRSLWVRTLPALSGGGFLLGIANAGTSVLLDRAPARGVQVTPGGLALPLALFLVLCGVTLVLSLRSGHSRRIAFAKIVSMEIARRRGAYDSEVRVSDAPVGSERLLGNWCGCTCDAVAA